MLVNMSIKGDLNISVDLFRLRLKFRKAMDLLPIVILSETLD